MKASRLIWLVLLMTTALVCWRTIPPPAASIRVENEVVCSGRCPQSSALSYDPYFIRVNDFRQILIPARQQP